MDAKTQAAIHRLQVIRNSQEDAISELLEWAADHIEKLSNRVAALEPIRNIGGVIHVDTTEDEAKGE